MKLLVVPLQVVKLLLRIAVGISHGITKFDGFDAPVNFTLFFSTRSSNFNYFCDEEKKSMTFDLLFILHI